ncbi:phosphate ABC transporter permease PstA [Litorivicinus lipolyticus]|uniref:Phosphate transport system permease protein PstA n=1 Tax=Litorivicinus lipolyticus TaxID=418701 RepID=A0A5Q2QA94_9GAMM|nr:phosphate ABC transporter permease PstA [Litorivicinus lipolyticus]QGG79191.1 phosphate ABC transporter permease PstA [Litorivicinus lipolyticus]
MTKPMITPQIAAERVARGVQARYARERRFQLIGKSAIGLALTFLAVLMTTILIRGIPGFFQYYVQVDVTLDAQLMDPRGDQSIDSFYDGNPRKIMQGAIYGLTGAEGRSAKKEAFKLLSIGGTDRIRNMVVNDPSLLGSEQNLWIAVDDDVDSYLRGHIKRATDEDNRRLSDRQLDMIDDLVDRGLIQYKISNYLFQGGASRNPELAGVKGAVVGSLFTLAITLILAFPIGVATAVYLEEFAPKNRLTEIIEVNINNLAAVPSVVFGILGLAVFIGFFGFQRSLPLVGGLVLALMTLPTIIISSRAALKAVPPSIRDAALGMGASRVQVITHHVLPLALPGMLTGTIIGMAQALGETAPLLMIGMVAFIVDTPASVMDPGTVLPVQIFMWADFAERMYVAKTSAAIIVLLSFLILMNAIAVVLRKKFERRW